MEEGLVVWLQFTAFALPSASYDDDGFDKDCADSLYIEDGKYDFFLEYKVCGSPPEIIHGLWPYHNGDYESMGSNLPNVTSKSNIAVITFKSYGVQSGPYWSGSRTGWSVTWSAVAARECQSSSFFVNNFINKDTNASLV